MTPHQAPTPQLVDTLEQPLTSGEPDVPKGGISLNRLYVPVAMLGLLAGVVAKFSVMGEQISTLRDDVKTMQAEKRSAPTSADITYLKENMSRIDQNVQTLLQRQNNNGGGR